MALPLPKVVADVEAGGPFVTAAKGLNSLRKLQAEAEYAPYTNYANALSKVAYARTAPANAIAQLMSGPAAANLSRDQQIALASQLQNMVKNNGDYSSDLPPPGYGRLFGNSLAGNVLGGLGGVAMPMVNKLLEKFGIKLPIDNINPVASVPNAAPSQNQGFSPSSNMMPATGQSPVQNLPFNRSAASLNLPGTQGGLNPNTGAEAQKASAIAGATGEATSQIKMWEPLHEEAAKEARLSQNVDDLADKFSDAYDRVGKYEKGPGLGAVPPWFSEAADTADRSAAGMADAVARAQQQGHITQADRMTYSGMKVNRAMRPETKERALEFIRGMNERTQERVPFQVAAHKLGLTPPEANAVWSNYIKKNPFYSAKEHRLLQENFNKWPEYLSGSKLQESLIPSASNQNRSKPSEGGGKMFNILDPQGNVVARGNLDQTSRFLKDHRGYSRVGI